MLSNTAKVTRLCSGALGIKMITALKSKTNFVRHEKAHHIAEETSESVQEAKRL